MDWTKVGYICFGSERESTVRLAAIGSILLDAVTTIYIMYFSMLPVREVNPLGAFLLSQGGLGEALFMAVPLANIVLVLYTPGLLGDAVSLTNVFVHVAAAIINVVNLFGSSVNVWGVHAPTVHFISVAFFTLFSLFYYYPRIKARSLAFEG